MKQEWLQLRSKKASRDKEVLWPIMPINDRIQEILVNSQKHTKYFTYQEIKKSRSVETGSVSHWVMADTLWPHGL